MPCGTVEQPCIWFHAVSVGEVNLLAVLLKEVAQQRPDVECCISTTTITGYDLAKQKYSQHTVFYCPLDFSWAVRRAMRRIRPSLVVLAELELWPNLIRAANEHGAKVAIVNGRLSERSFRGYHRIRRWLRSTLNRIDVIAVQTPEYAERFRALGAPSDRVTVTGSLKFDGATADRDNPRTQKLRELAGIAADDIVFLAGSTQDPEERLGDRSFSVADRRISTPAIDHRPAPSPSLRRSRRPLGPQRRGVDASDTLNRPPSPRPGTHWVRGQTRHSANRRATPRRQSRRLMGRHGNWPQRPAACRLPAAARQSC